MPPTLTGQVIIGDTREKLRALPDGFAQAIVTSPPYFGLRVYTPPEWIGGDAKCDHAAAVRRAVVRALGWENADGHGKSQKETENLIQSKSSTRHHPHCPACGARKQTREIGGERELDCGAWARRAFFGEEGPECGQCYVCSIRSVWRELWRVLRDDGGCWLNVGDCYWRAKGQSGAPTAEKQEARLAAGDSIDPIIRAKSLALTPDRLKMALQADGWIIRSRVIWQKKNPGPESTVTPRAAAWVSENDPQRFDETKREWVDRKPKIADRPHGEHEEIVFLTKNERYFYDADGFAPPVAECSRARENRGRSENHKYDPDGEKSAALVSHAGKSMRPARPNARKTKAVKARGEAINPRYKISGGARHDARLKFNRRPCRDVWHLPTAQNSVHFAAFHEELARRCIALSTRTGDVVLDPFVGSGTTAAVAESMARRWCGIDLDPRAAQWTRERLARTSRALGI